MYYFSADLIRVIAGLGVVTIHVTDYFVNYPFIFNGYSWWIANIFNSISRMAVPMFIMLSGFLILNPAKKYPLSEFIKNKVLKITALLIFWHLVYFVWGFYWVHNRSVENMVAAFFLAKNAHLYFLFIILGLYLITPLLRKFDKHLNPGNKKLLLAGLFFFSIVFNLIYYVFKLPAAVFNGLTFFIPFVSYYYLGHYLRNYFLSAQKLRLLILLIFNLAIINSVLAYFNTWFFSAERGQYFYDRLSINVALYTGLLFVFLLNFGKASFFQKNLLIRKITHSLSESILGVYLIHLITIDLLDYYTNWKIENLLSPLWPYIIIKIFLVFLTSYIAVNILKKIPYINYFV